jgi:hypothetical protein
VSIVSGFADISVAQLLQGVAILDIAVIAGGLVMTSAALPQLV